jgi:hypothetical protein
MNRPREISRPLRPIDPDRVVVESGINEIEGLAAVP